MWWPPPLQTTIKFPSISSHAPSQKTYVCISICWSAGRHVVCRLQRYLLAVNVMTASVLRGVVETALSDLLNFFRIHGAVAAARIGKGDDDGTPPPRQRRSGGGSGSGGAGGGAGSERGAGVSRETRREHGGPHDGARGGEPEPEEEGERLQLNCPPLFKVIGKRCSLGEFSTLLVHAPALLSSLNDFYNTF